MSQRISLLSLLQLDEAQLQCLRDVSPLLEVRQLSLSDPHDFSTVLTPDVEILYTHFGAFDLHLTPGLICG